MTKSTLADAYIASQETGKEMRYLLHAKYNFYENTWTLDDETYCELVDQMHQANRNSKKAREELDEHVCPQPTQNVFNISTDSTESAEELMAKLNIYLNYVGTKDA